MIVRDAVSSDSDALAAMIRGLALHEGMTAQIRFQPRDVQAALSGPDPRLRAFVAERDGRLLGFVSFTVDYSIWENGQIVRVDDVFVDAAARRDGVGTKLMLHLAAFACAQGMSARWELETENARAQKFYERLGAKVRPKKIAHWALADMRRVIS